MKLIFSILFIACLFSCSAIQKTNRNVASTEEKLIHELVAESDIDSIRVKLTPWSDGLIEAKFTKISNKNGVSFETDVYIPGCLAQNIIVSPSVDKADAPSRVNLGNIHPDLMDAVLVVGGMPTPESTGFILSFKDTNGAPKLVKMKTTGRTTLSVRGYNMRMTDNICR